MSKALAVLTCCIGVGLFIVGCGSTGIEYQCTCGVYCTWAGGGGQTYRETPASTLCLEDDRPADEAERLSLAACGEDDGQPLCDQEPEYPKFRQCTSCECKTTGEACDP